MLREGVQGSVDGAELGGAAEAAGGAQRECGAADDVGEQGGAAIERLEVAVGEGDNESSLIVDTCR